MFGEFVMPEYTRNWPAGRGAILITARCGRFDSAAMVVTVAPATAWIAIGDHPLVGASPGLAAAALAARLTRWRGLSAGAEQARTVLPPSQSRACAI